MPIYTRKGKLVISYNTALEDDAARAEFEAELVSKGAKITPSPVDSLHVALPPLNYATLFSRTRDLPISPGLKIEWAFSEEECRRQGFIPGPGSTFAK